VPLAAGERMSTIFGERELIERELVDVIQPDTGRAGGISQMKKIAAMAEAHHIMMAPHSGSLGPVAEYAALHVMAAIPNALFLERIEDDWEGRAHTVIPHPQQVDGFLAVPDSPGLGVDIDETSSRDSRARPTSRRRSARLRARMRQAPTTRTSMCRRACSARGHFSSGSAK
jgi:galactonate dehydratase